MANVFVRLLKAYRRHGFRVRTGLNPLYFGAPDSAFTHFQTDRGVPMSVGGGLAPQEIHFLECLFDGDCRPRNILVIGNAFGWSALALALLLPEARILAIDAGLEGDATDLGASLTHDIATEEGVAVRVVNALSPRDTSRVVASEFDGSPLDFVLVDGFHTNEQLSRDFAGVVRHASDDCVYVFHDVLHWHMLEGFNGLPLREEYERRVLTRCPSGMGIVFPSRLGQAARDAIDAFCDDTVDLATFHATLGATAASPGPTLTRRLAPGWKLRRLGMASTYEMEGKADLAHEQLGFAVAEACGDADSQVQVAAYYLHHGRHQEARPLLEEASRLRPDWAIPPHDLGLVMRALAGDVASIPYFQRAAELDPEWAAPHCELGAIQFRLGDDHEAMACLERALGLDSHLVAGHHLLGLAKGRCSGHLAAVADLERAVALDPTCAFTQYDLGLVKFHLGDDDAAIAHLERASAIAPDWAPPQHILGLARRRLGDNLAARLRLEHAVALDPDCAPALYDLALVTSCLNDDGAAIEHLERAITVAPDWAPGWREAGACAARLGRWNDAWVRLTRAVDLGYSNEPLWNEIAVACAKAEEWSRALDAFRRARRATPESRALDKEIAICLRALGRLGESESVLVEAIAAQPEWAGAHFELGRTCESLQQWERAEHAFQRSVELRPLWQDARDALERVREGRARAVPALPLAG